MDQSVSFLTGLLTGQLIFILIAAAVLAYPISILLLRLYRRAVLRSMGRSTDAAESSLNAEDASKIGTQKPPPPLRIINLPQHDAISLASTADKYCNQALGAPWRAAMVYSLGGICYAVIMAGAFLVSNELSFLPARFLMQFLGFIWPLVLTVCLVAGSTTRNKKIPIFAYIGGYCILGVIALSRSPDLSVGQIFIGFVVTNAMPTVLILAFYTRRVRAVGPMVFSFLVIAITGSVAILEIVAKNLGIANPGFSLGLGPIGVFVGFIVIGFAVFSIVGWFLVRWIKDRYQRKMISDQSLIIDTIWLLFGIVHAASFVFAGPLWILSGFAAFLAYKFAVSIGFSVFNNPITGSGVRLLLLRTFSLGKRSERLFEAFSTHWRYVGSVQMIAGPDLATATVEPHEFLEFITGKLTRRFIDSREAFTQRFSEMDLQPDRDWRFRINDFFCFDNTWQMVLTQIVSENDAVLMDLRGFSNERAGCIFELNELINSVSLDKVVFLVDSTTDEPFLRRIIEQTWNELRSTSPNYQEHSPHLRLFQYSESESNCLRQLLYTMLSATCSLKPRITVHQKIKEAHDKNVPET